jgi:hypothetical protein
MSTPIDSKLPYGDTLKSLLLQNQLSESYLKKTLQKKGIFIGPKLKSKTVPILCSCLLTPSEFSEIKEHRSEKESSTKQRSEKLKGKTKKPLNEIIPDLDITQICESEYNEYNFIGMPSFDMVDKNPNHLIMEYEIQCNNHIDSWTEQGKKYSASVEIKKTGDSIDTIAISNHTGSDTDKINRKILSSVKESLRNSGDIENTDTRILFNSFTNKNRIDFLWQLTGKSSSSSINFDRITDIDLKADKSLTPPSSLNIDWMIKEISRMHLSGDSLQNTFFLSNRNCYPFLLIWRMQATFRYEIKNTEGRCKVNFEFSNYPRRENAEFEIGIDSIVPDKPYKHVPTRSIRAAILEEFSQKKLDIVDQYI